MSLEDQKTLEVLPPPPPKLEPRNYWNTSGKGKEFFPTEPRPDSIPVMSKSGRIIQDPKDEWWINSAEHNYCFWSFLKSRSQPDGTMEPLLQSEIADLFGCSSTKIHFMLKEALDKLMAPENMKILQSLLEMTDEEPMNDSTPFGSFDDIELAKEEKDE